MNQQHIISQRYSLTIDGMQVELATLGHVLYHLNRHEMDPGVLPRPETLERINATCDGEALNVVEQRRPSGRVFGIWTSGSEKQAFLSMIDEIDREIMRIDGVQRAPHEMSYYDWMAVVSVGRAAYNLYPCFPGRTDVEVDFMSLCTEEFFRRFGHGHNGPVYGNGDTNARHDVHVAYALMQGKPVPEYVIAWYRDGDGQRKSKATDLSGFDVVLAVPELRGALTPDQFRFLSHARREIEKQTGEKLPVTFDALKPYVEVLTRLDRKATSVDADNALTEAGLLKTPGLPETMTATPPDLSALSEATRELHAMLADAQFENTVKRLDLERSNGNLSERAYLSGMEIAKRSRETYSPTWAIQMATAIEKRDVEFLLRALDQADSNETSKLFFAKRYGVKLKGLNQQKRRAAIYAYCGYSPELQAQHEGKLQGAKEATMREREAKHAAEVAERVKVKTPDGVKTMRQFIDDAVADGFTMLLEHRHGKFHWCLFNPEKRTILGLSVSQGGLAYARDTLRLPVHPKLG
ncbi:hypothetical protein [Paraburkholderia sp. J8-2]|uniref:hypothetical protein n=1 Tax=Paraburkholderia sp. J8-2 TaxID=2805440 RepID=UPI002AB6E422|nr:hypothetical protein [Paraburkholderia sp. J8-2]